MARENNQVFEIGLMVRARWELHSLNNEGTVGNVTEPRTVVLADGTKTDGVSGEMLKHIHSYHLWLLETDKSRFCPACAVLQPQKADWAESKLIIASALRGIKDDRGRNIAAIDKALQTCLLCDIHGFLLEQRVERGGAEQAEQEESEMTQRAPRVPNVSRRSTVEFGWAVGIKDEGENLQVHRDIHIHARHAMGERRTQEVSVEERRRREVAAQMLYHRPTRSATYAVVSVFQPWRIGLNEINYEYAIDDDIRRERYRLALEAYKAAWMRAEGAMTSTRLPHTEAVEGVLAVSSRNFPVPVVSPLNRNYKEAAQAIAQLNRGVSLHPFASVAELCSLLDSLAQREPYRMEGRRP
jgi:CRISPR-associated protein Cst2